MISKGKSRFVDEVHVPSAELRYSAELLPELLKVGGESCLAQSKTYIQETGAAHVSSQTSIKETCADPLSSCLSQASFSIRRTIPTTERKWKVIPANSSYGGALPTAVSPMVTRMVDGVHSDSLKIGKSIFFTSVVLSAFNPSLRTDWFQVERKATNDGRLPSSHHLTLLVEILVKKILLMITQFFKKCTTTVIGNITKMPSRYSFDSTKFHGLSQMTASLTRESIAERETAVDKTTPWPSADSAYGHGSLRRRCSAVMQLPMKKDASSCRGEDAPHTPFRVRSFRLRPVRLRPVRLRPILGGPKKIERLRPIRMDLRPKP